MQTPHAHAHPEIARLQRQGAEFRTSVLSANTLKSYAYDWAMFQAFCRCWDLQALPATAETVSLYMAALIDQGKKVVTARRRATAVRHYHRVNGHPSPITDAVTNLLIGAQRVLAEKPREMRPLSVAQLRAISEALAAKGSSAAVRNRAILLVGFASALRRSNLAALQMDDVEFTDRGVILSIGREKNDQEGKGRLIGIPRGKRSATCPVRCLRAWLKVRGWAPGNLFCRIGPTQGGKAMDGEAIERIVKRCVALIGLDPRDRWAAHSLRAGLVTAAGEAGTIELVIMAQTGQRNPATLRKYFRRANLFRANACFGIGL